MCLNNLIKIVLKSSTHYQNFLKFKLIASILKEEGFKWKKKYFQTAFCHLLAWQDPKIINARVASRIYNKLC